MYFICYLEPNLTFGMVFFGNQEDYEKAYHVIDSEFGVVEHGSTDEVKPFDSYDEFEQDWKEMHGL